MTILNGLMSSMQSCQQMRLWHVLSRMDLMLDGGQGLWAKRRLEAKRISLLK
jgi:hypothetical protein